MADIKIFAKTIEETAKAQVDLIMEQPGFKDEKVRIMPDVHAGKGCVIGFTSTYTDKIIPNVVGVDIGCGMMSTSLKINGEPDLKALDGVIRMFVPSGMDVHEQPIRNQEGNRVIRQLRCFKHLKNVDRIYRSLGTLGGGNHFIELGISDSKRYYLTVHTGSRNLGKQVADYYQALAVEVLGGRDKRNEFREFIIDWSLRVGEKHLISQRLKQLSALDLGAGVPKGLEYLTGKNMKDYLHDAVLCAIWADENRRAIIETILYRMSWLPKTSISSVHNYIDEDMRIIRKGAISAKAGEPMVIPMNMRDGLLICVGKGNDDWNQSAPHGAGRIMGRAEAFRRLSLDDYQASMKGIYSTSVNKGTLDEAPMAYKPMQEIIDAIGDTVKVERAVRPIYNFKASE